MGASKFETFHQTDDLTSSGRRKAFNALVEEAKHEEGHGGYTGTIAEKHSFTFIEKVATIKDARDRAYEMIERGDKRIGDKHGPAGCIEVEKPCGFLFFGLAKS